MILGYLTTTDSVTIIVVAFFAAITIEQFAKRR